MRHYIRILSLSGFLCVAFSLSANLAWGFSVASVDDYSIHFAPGTAEIREESMPILQAVASTLKVAQPLHAIIQGHADAFEKKHDVVRLSQRRAQAVRDLLISWGIDSCRLTIEAFGSGQPVAANNTEAGRARNRRVEFKSFVPPPILEGVKQVPVKELEKKLEREPNQNNSGRFLVLARLNQAAYARQTVALPVETWSGPEETYPWVEGDPAEEKLASDPPRLSAVEAKQHLTKAIRYFSKVIHFPPGEPAILGLPDYPAKRKLKAYRGLLWCLWQSGENNKAREIYPKYLEAAKALDQEEGGGSNIGAACKMLVPVFGNIPDCEPGSEK